MIKQITYQHPDYKGINHIWNAKVGTKMLMGDKVIQHGNVISISDEGDFYLIHFEENARRKPLLVPKKAKKITIVNK